MNTRQKSNNYLTEVHTYVDTESAEPQTLLGTRNKTRALEASNAKQIRIAHMQSFQKWFLAKYIRVSEPLPQLPTLVEVRL